MDKLTQYTDFDNNYNIIIGGYGFQSQNDRPYLERTLKFAKFMIFHTRQQFRNNFYYYGSDYSMSCAGDSGEYDYN